MINHREHCEGKRMKFVHAVIALTIIGMPSLLYAHGNLASSAPEDGSRIREVTQIQLVFSATVRLEAMRIRNTDGAEVELESTSTDSAITHTISLDEPLTPGRYSASWRSISSDSHVVNGEIRFIVID